MSDSVNMDSFIQDTLRSMRRPRDSDFYSDQPSIISTSTKKFTTTGTPDAPAVVSPDCDLPTQATETKTSWYVSEALPPSGSLSLNVESGQVTAEDGTVINYGGGSVSGLEGAHVVYLQLSYPAVGEACTSINVNSAASLPPDTTTEKHRRIASVVGTADEEGLLRLTSSTQRLTEDVVLGVVDGEQGGILYWDATKNYWVPLPAPSGSGIRVLTHDGTVPSWTETEECNTSPSP
jgi:hypothetical protein